MELISVIISAYNVKDYLERCVNSVRNQTYQALEIILVDDGSTDGTSELCDEIAKQDFRIRVIHKENGGLASARNAGVRVATGTVLSFVDSDDYIELDMYEHMVAEIKDDSVSMVVSGMIVTDMQGNNTILVAQQKMYMTKEHALSDLLEESVILPSSVNKLFRKDLFEKVHYVEGIINEDTEIIPRIIIQCDHIVVLDRALYHYVLRQNSITQLDFDMKNYQSLIAYKSIVEVCELHYPNLFPSACYYELSELYQSLVMLNKSQNRNEMKKQLLFLRMQIGQLAVKCTKWKIIRNKYKRELLIYVFAALFGYRCTYRLMMIKQKIEN